MGEYMAWIVPAVFGILGVYKIGKAENAADNGNVAGVLWYGFIGVVASGTAGVIAVYMLN